MWAARHSPAYPASPRPRSTSPGRRGPARLRLGAPRPAGPAPTPPRPAPPPPGSARAGTPAVTTPSHRLSAPLVAGNVVLVHQPVEGGPIHAGQPRRLRHVASGPRDQPGEVFLLEMCDHPLLRRRIRLVGYRPGAAHSHRPLARVVVDRDVGRLDVLVGVDEHGGVLNDVLQLAPVAPPPPQPEKGDARLAQSRHLHAAPPVPPPAVGEEVVRQQRDVLLANHFLSHYWVR